MPGEFFSSRSLIRRQPVPPRFSKKSRHPSTLHPEAHRPGCELRRGACIGNIPWILRSMGCFGRSMGCFCKKYLMDLRHIVAKNAFRRPPEASRRMERALRQLIPIFAHGPHALRQAESAAALRLKKSGDGAVVGSSPRFPAARLAPAFRPAPVTLLSPCTFFGSAQVWLRLGRVKKNCVFLHSPLALH